MRGFNLLLLCCLVLLEYSTALRRIKRTSTVDASHHLGIGGLHASLSNATGDVEKPLSDTKEKKDASETNKSPFRKGDQPVATSLLADQNNQQIAKTKSVVTKEVRDSSPLAFLLGKDTSNGALLSDTERKKASDGSIADVLIIENQLRSAADGKDFHKRSDDQMHANAACTAEILPGHNGNTHAIAINAEETDLKRPHKSVVKDDLKVLDTISSGTHTKRNKDHGEDSKFQQSHDEGNKQGKNPITLLTRSSSKGDNSKQLGQQHIIAKLAPMADVLKLANMLLYRIGLESNVPMHAQGSQMLFSSSPNAAFAVNPIMESDDLDAIDYFYNALDSKPNVRSSAAMGLPRKGASTLMQRPMLAQLQQQPYAANDAAMPFNFIEGALDMLLSSGDDDDESEIELRCPIHHEPRKKLVTVGGGESPEPGGKDDLIQVCSCRLIKKKPI